MQKENFSYITLFVEYYARRGRENELRDIINSRCNKLRSKGIITNNFITLRDREDERKFFELYTLAGHDALEKIDNNEILMAAEKKNSIPLINISLSDNHYCVCSGWKSVLFVTDPLTGTSPIRCEKCKGEVPLYRFEEERIPIGRIKEWELLYDNIWYLFTFSQSYEDWADLELGHFDSKVNTMGYELSQEFQKKTKIKAYYLLTPRKIENYDSEYLRNCPRCGKEWSKENIPFPAFDYICDECGLISTAPELT